jgi:hypothetical protein
MSRYHSTFRDIAVTGTAVRYEVFVWFAFQRPFDRLAEVSLTLQGCADPKGRRIYLSKLNGNGLTNDRFGLN